MPRDEVSVGVLSFCSIYRVFLQILKPAEKKQKFVYVGSAAKDSKKGTMK